MGPRRRSAQRVADDEQRRRLEEFARDVRALVGHGSVRCAVVENGTLLFGGAAPASAKPHPQIPAGLARELVATIVAGDIAQLSSDVAKALGGSTATVVPWKTAGDSPGACVLLDQQVEAGDERLLQMLGERVARIVRLAAERDELRATVHQLEQSADAFRALVENTSDAVLVLDLDGRVRVWNHGSEELFGWSAQEALGQVLPHVPKTRRTSTLANLREIATGQVDRQSELPATRKDGSAIVFVTTCVPLSDADGLPVGVLCVGRSLTADSRFEELQDRFVSLVTQELRNPLTAIAGYSQLLGRPEIGEDPVKRTRTVRALESRAQQMASLVDDLLVAARVEEGGLRLELEPTDLPGVVTETVTRFERFESQRRLILDIDTRMPVALVDPVRVGQALTNLLSNAVRYSPEAKEVLVELVLDGEEAVLSVTDHGVGIDPEHAARVFDRFYRVQGDAGTGAGLGLYLVKLIAEAHGGDVGVTSKKGLGSTFEFRLPLQVDGPPRAASRRDRKERGRE